MGPLPGHAFHCSHVRETREVSKTLKIPTKIMMMMTTMMMTMGMKRHLVLLAQQISWIQWIHGILDRTKSSTFAIRDILAQVILTRVQTILLSSQRPERQHQRRRQHQRQRPNHRSHSAFMSSTSTILMRSPMTWNGSSSTFLGQQQVGMYVRQRNLYDVAMARTDVN